MVAVKGRPNPPENGVKQAPKITKSVGQVTNFKIYAEVDKVKSKGGHITRGKTALGDSAGYLLNADDSKSNMKPLEKNKSKAVKSVKLTVRRKVLADISNNVKGTFERTERSKNFGPARAKDSGKNEASSSAKQARESRGLKLHLNQDRARLNLVQHTNENKTTQKVACSDKSKTKFQGRTSTSGTTAGMKSVTKPLQLTRKSLPVLKQVGVTETRRRDKENLEKSDRSRGKHGLPVKPTLRTSIVLKSSKLSSRPLGNRVSDGFLLKESRTQAKLSSRKSLNLTKPTLRDTTTTFNAKTSSNSSKVLATKKLRSFGNADLSKKKQNKSSLCKEVPTVASQQIPTPEESSSGVATAATETLPKFSLRRISDRRDSFTSSLISRSKFAKECSSTFMLQKTLPEIYDSHNHLDVSEYVDDIYQYYWVMEAQNPLLENYMEIQRDVTPQMRGILINWLIEVHKKFDLMDETLFLTVTLLDRYLSLENVKKNEFQLVGLTALMLASKYEDFWHPRVADLISISAESYTRDQMLNMEKTMLKKLKFRLNEPTLYVFMLRFIRAAQADTKFEHLSFYLIELCLVQYEALKYKPSMLCASAIYVARCTMQMSPPWTPLLAKHTRYEESQIRGCTEMILKFHKAAKTALLQVTHEKYLKTGYSKVASIRPLLRLP